MNNHQSIHHGILRSIAAGLVWLTVLYLVDIVDSILLILDSTERLSGDKEITGLITSSVLFYVLRMYLGYLFLGLLAGGIVHFTQKLWYPKAPTKKAFWGMLVVLGATVSVWGTLRQVLVMPTIHDWMGIPTLRLIHDTLPIWCVDALGAAMVISSLVVAFNRWKGFSYKGFFSNIGLLLCWLGGSYWLLSNPAPETAVKNSGPNVIFIGVDALRPSHLKLNDYERDAAPNIDALLGESAVFTQAFTPLARTYPSWSSILTGVWPITHGIRDNLPTPENLVPSQSTLGQVLSTKGYHTSFITDDSRFSYMIPEMGFDQIYQPEVNVQNFAISMTEPRFRVFHSWMHNPIGFALVPVIRHNQAFGKSYQATLFSDAAVNELAKASKHSQFFYALHSCVLHAPGDRNYPWSMMFGQKGYTGRNRFRYSRSGTAILKATTDDNEPSNVISEQDRRIYDSGLMMADELVGKLMDELKSSGLWDNSIVVLLSDHGENMWSPDLPYNFRGPNHGFHPYGDGQHQVVLAIHFPDGEYQDQTVDAPVRLIDIAPTISEFLNLGMSGFDGQSLLPLLRGEKEAEPRLVYIETGLSEKNYWPKDHKNYPFKQISERYTVDIESRRVHIKEKFLPFLIAAKDRSIQLGRWKLVWRPLKDGAKVELFDRFSDPENRVDVYHKNVPLAAHLGLKMRPFLEQDGVDTVLFDSWERLIEGEPSPDWWK